MYNLTQIQTSINPLELIYNLESSNILKAGTFGLFVLISVFFIAFISFGGLNEPKKSFTASSFIIFVLGMLLIPLGLLSVNYYIVIFYYSSIFT